MIPLDELLLLAYPKADFTKDIILRDNGDGKGLVIHEWNLVEPRPSTEDIQKLTIILQEQYSYQENKVKFNVKNREILNKLDVIDKKSIRALRENNIQKLTDLNNQAIALRARFIEVT